jgi:hypothetical protein
MVAAFVVAFAGTLALALSQGAKPFIFDAAAYWDLANMFTQNGHFSLLNFGSPTRGYALPLIDHGLRVIGADIGWSDSMQAKLFNTLVFALIGTVLAPGLAEIVWPSRRWGLGRRLLLTAVLLVFWSGYLSVPLSDFPALAAVLLAFIGVVRAVSPGWMLIAGLAGGLALDVRAAYVLVAPMLIVLVAWAWLGRRDARPASIARRALCGSLLIAGFAVVSLPQSLAMHRHYNSWSFIPGSVAHQPILQLEAGLHLTRRDTYTGSDHAPVMLYYDEAGMRLQNEQKGGRISGFGQWAGLILHHPIVMGGVIARHLINELDARYSTAYVEHLDTATQSLPRLGGFLIVFLAFVRVLWPTARRRLGPARWRYPIALMSCCLPVILTGADPRYLLPIYLVSYLLVLTPGWPSPIVASEVGLRRFRTLAIIAVAYVAFMAVIWNVTSEATRNLHFLS